MARDESDREDLLREATALVERIELAPIDAPHGDHVVVGFRSAEALSVFHGNDPVYQFNTAGQLRRAYCDGLLYRAARGRLVSLRRVRQMNEVQLLSHELTDAEQSSFITSMFDRLRELAADLEAGRYSVVGQVPADADVLSRVRHWLATHDGLPIATSPHV